MTERVEAIRRRIEKGLDVVIAGDTPAQDWDITDDVEQWLTALAQAEREREEMRAERNRSAEYGIYLDKELDKARAEVERLKGENAAMLVHHRAAAEFLGAYEHMKAALARTRAAVPTEVEKILSLANGLSTRLKGTPDMYEANKIMHAAWAIQAALEGRG